MPIVLKTGAMKYKKEDGTYGEFNALTEQFTDAQIQAVQTAAAQQISAIQQKGQQTRASVPDDYTTLADQVSGLKGAFETSVGEPVPWKVGTQGKYQPHASGATANNDLYDVTDFINISGYKYLRYSALCSTANSTKVGIAFFSETEYHSYISGVSGYAKFDVIEYKEQMAKVPDGAVYARFTLMAGDTNEFFIEGYKNVEEAFLDTLKQGGMYPSSYITEWLQGGINTSTGAVVTSNTKCRSAGFISGYDIAQSGKVLFEVKDGYNLTCVAYNYPPSSTSGSSDAYAETIFTEKTGKFVLNISPELYYRFVVGNVASENMAPSAVPNDVAKYTRVQWTDKTLSAYGTPADANITGEILYNIESAIGNGIFEPSYNIIITGGITPTGADMAVAHRARTQYITITPGIHYCIELASETYSFLNVFTYNSAAQSAVTRQIPIINGRYISFKAGENDKHIRMSFYYTSDKDGHDFTEEEGETIKSLISIKMVQMPIGKKSRTGTNEWFTVTVHRPTAFGGSEVNEEEQEIECILRLPTSYSATGTPTRAVLACHGAEGYIDQATEHWAATGWDSLMSAILSAGYAVFDCNVLPASAGTNAKGFCVGSPLALDAAKKAYDYVQANYNVYREIFVHGTSMGGTLASAFTQAYPQLVLAESSMAGRDLSLYLYRVENGTYSDSNPEFAQAWGYESVTAMKNDKWSHIVGMGPVLSLHKYENGVMQYPPDRETNFDAWVAYYSDIQKKTKNDAIGDYTAYRAVPYKTWESWGDSPSQTKAKLIMHKALRANGCMCEAVVYDNYDHDDIGFGKVEDMRNQLIAWYKRWE